VAGRPVIEWSLDALAQAACDPVVVVLPEAWMEPGSELWADRDLRFAVGGETRQESIYNGLTLVDKEIVVVQDAARPMVTSDLVKKTINALGDFDAVVPGVPMDETLKSVDGPSRVVIETVDRSLIWRAQTPAAFRTDSLKTAHERARSEGFIATDEAQLIERYGGRVLMIEGSRVNLKVTWPGDFEVAEALLSLGR
jgi:2-C-methyl-D-erythritol 4-phosphate cytidylyltransferase